MVTSVKLNASGVQSELGAAPTILRQLVPSHISNVVLTLLQRRPPLNRRVAGISGCADDDGSAILVVGADLGGAGERASRQPPARNTPDITKRKSAVIYFSPEAKAPRGGALVTGGLKP